MRQFSVMGTTLPDPTPVVFLHGVGLGILPYVDFVCSLVCTGHPVVVVEYRHVAMRLCWRIPTCSEVAEHVVAILDKIGVAKASFVSHSYGTFVLSRIIKTHKERVQSSCFIDPVCIGEFNGMLRDGGVPTVGVWIGHVTPSRIIDAIRRFVIEGFCVIVLCFHSTIMACWRGTACSVVSQGAGQSCEHLSKLSSAHL